MRRFLGAFFAVLVALPAAASAGRAMVEPVTEPRLWQAGETFNVRVPGGIYKYDSRATQAANPGPHHQSTVSAGFCNYDGLRRSIRRQFTAKLRDYESGLNLDYFGARYYAGAMGRFTSADKPFNDQFAGDPQSWNLYSYTRNNPLKYVDQQGEWLETAWDVANIVWGAKSFVDNIGAGSYGAAALDAGGVLLDTVAAVVPILPGGAGAILKGARTAEDLVDAGQTVRQGANILDNARAGKAFEKEAASVLKTKQPDLVEQITVKTESGVRTRLDTVGTQGGSVAVTDAKSSATAGFTRNQRRAYPEIEKSGATVVGRGKGAFPGGTQIPPTKVDIVRPEDLEKLKKLQGQ